MENLLGVMKSNLFDLGMDILFSQFVRVSFFVVTSVAFYTSSDGPTSLAVRLALDLFSIRKSDK